MKCRLLTILIIPVLISSCTKCVECEIKLKESQTVLGNIDELCGTDKKVSAEEDRLREDYTCIECKVVTPSGPINSGVRCGDRAFTDSIEAGWDQAAFDIGTDADCTYYRDTVNVTCILN